MAVDDLYERDFYLWTQAQAEALRAAGKAKRGSNAVEWERLAEEVEDMGKSQRNRALGHTVRILEHLFKLACSTQSQVKGHWIAEVRAQRGALKRVLTPSLRLAVERELEELHAEGADLAQAGFDVHEPSSEVERTLRWSLAQILGEEDDPLA